MKELIINGENINPGENTRIDVNIARLPSHSEINISVNVQRAMEEGPVILLSGGLHGDEINGIETVRRLHYENNINLVRGTIIFLPIINIYGFINFSREVPDGKDINRSFPGNKSGSLASRVAHFLMKEIIPKIDYGVDYHTGGASRTNYPQVRCVLKDKKNRELAKAFNAPFTINAPYRPNSLRRSAGKLGKQILVYESGESMRLDELGIKEGIKGTLNLLNYLGMIDNNLDNTDNRESIIINKSTWVRARYSGLFLSKVESGQYVQKNELLGNITDPFGDFTLKIKSPVSGFIIGKNNNPVIHQGDALLHIGLFNN